MYQVFIAVVPKLFCLPPPFLPCHIPSAPENFFFALFVLMPPDPPIFPTSPGGSEGLGVRPTLKTTGLTDKTKTTTMEGDESPHSSRGHWLELLTSMNLLLSHPFLLSKTLRRAPIKKKKKTFDLLAVRGQRSANDEQFLICSAATAKGKKPRLCVEWLGSRA